MMLLLDKSLRATSSTDNVHAARKISEVQNHGIGAAGMAHHPLTLNVEYLDGEALSSWHFDAYIVVGGVGVEGQIAVCDSVDADMGCAVGAVGEGFTGRGGVSYEGLTGTVGIV